MRYQLGFSLALIFFGCNVWSATIYVDCKSSGTGADGTQSKPFANLQTGIDRIVSTGGTLQLASGSCRGSFNINNLQAPLVINGAGSSSTSISGSQSLSGWTQHSGGIYKLRTASPVGQIFVNGQFLKRARYPRTGFLNIGADAPADLPSAQNLTLQTAASDLAFLAGKDLSNATITARIVDYWYNSAVVSSFNATTGLISIASAPSQRSECYPNCYFTYNPKKDWGYYLENKIWMMEAGSWIYDAPSQTAYVYLPDGSNPSSATTLEVAYDRNVVNLSNSPSVTFKNLQIINSGMNAVNATKSPNLIFNQVQVKNIYRIAFVFDGDTQPWQITNSLVVGTGSDVIRQHYTAKADAGILLENNDFQNIATPLGPRFSAAAVLLNSYYPSPAVIRNNRFKNIAYVAIFGLGGALIEGNTIENFCLLADDCGGIHISDRQPFITVRNNVLRNASPYLPGKGRGAYPVAGIYLDDHSNGMSVVENTVENTDIGIMLHDAHDNVIQNNNIFNYKVYGIRSADDDVRKKFDRPSGVFVPVLNSSGQTFPATANNLFVGNVIGSKYSAIPLFIYSNNGTGNDKISAALKGNGNTFLNPTSTSYLRFSNVNGSKDFTFEELQALGVDRFPMRTFDTIFPNFQTTSENATIIAGSTADLLRFDIWSANRTATKTQTNCPLTSSSGVCLLYTTAASEVGLAVSPGFAIAKDNFYRARVQLRSGNSKPSILGISVKQNATPYANMDALGQQLSVQAITTSGKWTTYDIYFKAAATLSSARIDFNIPVSTQVIFGGFDVKNVSTQAIDFSQYVQFNSNLKASAFAQVACGLSGSLCSGWRDLEGSPVFFPFSLQPLSGSAIWRDPTQSALEMEPDLGMVSRVELETATIRTITDAGTNGAIRPTSFDFASGGGGLAALDQGDDFSFPVSLSSSGSYHFAIRVRTGYSNTSASVPTSYLTTKNNYQVYVDGVAVELIADLDGISGPDPKGGGVYWGYLYSPNLNLPAGSHTIRMRMNSNWQMVDVLEVLTAEVPFPRNSILVTAPTPDMNPPGAGTSQRIELAKALISVIADVGSNGTIANSAFSLASGGAGLMAADQGDEFSFPVRITVAGSYHFAVRVRVGYSSTASYDPYSYLRSQNNYLMSLNGKTTQLSADLKSLSAVDSQGGGVYWGTLYTPNVSLAVGTHTIRLKMNSNWQMLDYVDVLPAATALPENLFLVSPP